MNENLTFSLTCVVAACPSGFKSIVTVAGVSNNCYRAGTDLTWSDAANTCKFLHNSHLVVIDNAEEQAAIKSWWMTQIGGKFTQVFLQLYTHIRIYLIQVTIVPIEKSKPKDKTLRKLKV